MSGIIVPDLKALASGVGVADSTGLQLTWIDDIKGRSALGQSDPPQSNFLGVAFRLVDDQTHDAVYFRPFNFRAEDPDRKSH
ncbi:MAG TPA: hypothetical protein PLC98_04175 [Anaerolineales bacterium]|nr:hypothetical protein [Anaerolineales bacterium]